MRILLLIALLVAGPAAGELAQPIESPATWPAHIPRTVVAVNVTARDHTVLLRDTCGWPGGARRAYHADQGRVTWACWGYTEAGVMFEWSTGQHTTMPFSAFQTSSDTRVTYAGLHTQLNPGK
jgi:hypothetical protein